MSPLLAMWVLIFHFRLTAVQMTMHSRVAAMMPHRMIAISKAL